jgi:2,3-bisphosphoglycerate-independent phosphoglycerate mutase
MKKTTALIIMDGFGIGPSDYGNAIAAAKKPNLDKYLKTCPHTVIGASGLNVGLPDGQMGNSEVGHTNIGAGRDRLSGAAAHHEIHRGRRLFHQPAFVAAVDAASKSTKALHLLGLMSDGGVHSHNTHLYALLELAKARRAQKGLCPLLHGRPRRPAQDSGRGFIEELQKEMDKIGVGRIATVEGRYYAMDRDNRWDRVSKAYAAIVYGEGVQSGDAADAMAKVLRGRRHG